MDETVQLPSTRRRSSILPRRSIGPPIVDGQLSGDANSEPSNTRSSQLQPSGVAVQGAEEESGLQSCVEILSTELDSWKNLRSERKLLKNPENRKTILPQLSWETAHEFLSEEDIALLKNTPPYEEIYESYDRLVKETAFLRVKYDRCVQLNRTINSLLQARLDTIKRDIGEYSEDTTKKEIGEQTEKLQDIIQKINALYSPYLIK